ncbi:hypothetical protein WH95_16495 [Kiloniella litopenaei]|uniref:Uncharacterized protein n=1 Tax=Kiloniella litopenaei TaxID=1549748 RepID=A0A0M2R8F9_9PROT|nr:hypothetical protein [Kiloniella litopenaei]KKJ75823.1 hypothetical protein WH95_16495 [Kiloniella litopenaei]
MSDPPHEAAGRIHQDGIMIPGKSFTSMKQVESCVNLFMSHAVSNIGVDIKVASQPFAELITEGMVTMLSLCWECLIIGHMMPHV